MEYFEWLKSCTKSNGVALSQATINKYYSGVKVISEEMIRGGVISKSLFDMSLIELDMAIALIFKNDHFSKKNKKGNNMYSNALKRYRCYKFFNTELGQAEMEEEKRITDNATLSITEKETIIKSRIGQGEYRRKLLQKYKGCIVTGVDIPQTLIASHIKPWAVSSNDERIDVNNGLLLTATYDKLFDSGLITFDKKGKMLISSLISNENRKKLNLVSDKIYDIRYTNKMEMFLKYHNDIIFVK